MWRMKKMKDVKRVVSTGYWEDDLIINEFTPEDKYFMLYLLTNRYTTQLGIYHLPIKFVAIDMGYSEDSVRNLLDRFENKYGIIKFSKTTNEIAIKNYLRHSIVKGGKPVMDCLIKEEQAVEDKSLLLYIYNSLIDRTDTNNTVKEYLDHLSNIYNIYNDNDNERFVHDSSTIRPEDKKLDLEKVWNDTANFYPNHNGMATAKSVWMDKMLFAVDKNETAKLIYMAIKIWKDDYKANHPDEQIDFKFAPRFDKWLKEDCDFWINKYEKMKQEG